MKQEQGSIQEFRTNWDSHPESARYYFKRGEPENQIQIAFQNHWRVFREIIGNRSGNILDVGCGRGSIGAFFANAGFNVHLLDSSETALRNAIACFRQDGLTAQAICGDTLCLPYDSGVFDVIVSIGLLEHFEDIESVVTEQLRTLKPGGTFLGYVVPERTLSVQTLAVPLNRILRWTSARALKGNHDSKVPLYRSTYGAADYVRVLKSCGVREYDSFGMFPVPLVSHSPAFPFSLMSPRAERALVKTWELLLSLRSHTKDPWICSERWGLAFLVWGKR